jgi:hypothetical protein
MSIESSAWRTGSMLWCASPSQVGMCLDYDASFRGKYAYTSSFLIRS